ncbi:MAG: HK97 family phage prohead protease [Proteobacteria bacterium]|nr:HK97 family phage prohead protease [Pseudomonadota bacterium]
MKKLRINLQAKAPGKFGIIEGYGATFNGDPDAHGDIIAPGAFSRSLATHDEAGTLPALLWGHDQSNPLGRWLNIFEDDHGLFVEGKLSMKVQKAADAFELAQDGALALSIGFGNATRTPVKGGQLLSDIQLAEISLVGLPSNPSAKITAVKSLGSIRDFENLLRKEYGLSAREAKKLSMGGWNAYKGKQAEHNQMLDDIRASANNWRTK